MGSLGGKSSLQPSASRGYRGSLEFPSPEDRDSLTPDQKSAVQAFLHWLYRKRILEHVEYFDYEKSVFAYWGYPAGHPRPSAQEPGESLPPMIDGAKRSDSGEWVNGGPNCLLINRLIWKRLIHVDQREGGWPKLYHDPADGSWWETLTLAPRCGAAAHRLLTQLPVEQVSSSIRPAGSVSSKSRSRYFGRCLEEAARSTRTKTEPCPARPSATAVLGVQFDALTWEADRNLIVARVSASGSWDAVRWLRSQVDDRGIALQPGGCGERP